MGIASECVFDTDNRNALLPSVVVHEAGARARNTPTPEHPIPYPSGPVTGVSFVVPHVGSDSPLPLSMVRMFKGVRLADSVYERLLNTITPKLRSTIFRIFRAVDCALVATKPPPAAPREWTENSWNNSLRCGMMTLRLDSSADVYTGVDANPFWTGALSQICSPAPVVRKVRDALASGSIRDVRLEQALPGSTRKSL